MATATFNDFDLDPRLLQAVEALGFDTPTNIQQAAIPELMAGKDVVGRARTGSGKTAAFGLPMLHTVREAGSGVQALVLAPTRELALQVTEALRSFADGLRIPMVTLYGGASYTPQLKALRQGVSVVVATPGRLLDHMDKGTIDLSTLKVIVLDEADEMLRMGFIDDVETILAATPSTRQVALFSATMPAAIRKIADAHLKDAVTVGADEGTATTDHIKQGWVRVAQRHKLEALQRLLAGEVDGTALVFARTRAGCAEVADALVRTGVAADALHGDMAQPARERVLDRLRSQQLSVVVATDVASRGIDVDHITHVINLDLPPDHETYVHRIGRTGRAGRQGMAISLVTPAEVGKLKRWMRFLKVRIEPMEVPSNAMIRERRLDRLREALASAQEGPAFRNAAEFVATTLEDDAWTPERLAAAAIAMLGDQHGLGSAPPEPTEARRERPDHSESYERDDRDDRPPRDRSDHSMHPAESGPELFFPVGHNRGVRPGDLVGALANECGVPGSAIGKITIVETKSFVQLPAPVVDRILREHPRLQIRGNEVPVDRARARADFGPPGGEPRGPDRAPLRPHYKRTKSWKKPRSN